MSDLSMLRLEAGLSRPQAAQIFGRSERTWRRWELSQAPTFVFPLLELLSGHLDLLGWPGWRIVRGELYAPDLRYGWRQVDLYAAWWHRQRLDHLVRLREAERAAAGDSRAAFSHSIGVSLLATGGYQR